MERLICHLPIRRDSNPLPIAQVFILTMCVLMCIISCGKTGSVPSHTEKTEWGYEAENGPDVWAQLNPKYALCANGKYQSPIDLVNPTPVKLPSITYAYNSTTGLNIQNTGYTIQVAYPEGSWI